MAEYIAVMKPVTLTDAMLISTTVAAEDSTAVWVSGETLTAGDQRHRVETHAVYRRLNSGGANTELPELDPYNWQRIRTTNLWAMFNASNTSATRQASPLGVVLQPDTFNAIYFNGLVGTGLVTTVKDEPGGTVLNTTTSDLEGRIVLDEWDYDYAPFKQLKDLLIEGVTPVPGMELTATITSGGGDVACSMFQVGDLRRLGRTLAGVEAEPLSYSKAETDEFGDTTFTKRPGSKGFRASALLSRDEADAVLDILEEVDGIPCLWIAASSSRYRNLRAYGTGRGRITYPENDSQNCIFTLEVKGSNP